MLKVLRVDELNVGDRVEFLGVRKVEQLSVETDGLWIVWYEGYGPAIYSEDEEVIVHGGSEDA